MTRRSRARAAAAEQPAGTRRSFGLRLVRNTLLWMVPMALVWLALTPVYNRFLEVAGQNVIHLLVESPNVTRLVPKDDHFALIARTDFPPSDDVVGSFRVTDLHFHFILLAALFLGTPDLAWRKRLGDLGVALLITAFFHIALVVFWIQFTYTTQLGSWSLEHYGAVARNLWGLGKHVLDLPVKLAFPLILWAAFYLDRLLPPAGDAASDTAPAKRS